MIPSWLLSVALAQEPEVPAGPPAAEAPAPAPVGETVALPDAGEALPSALDDPTPVSLPGEGAGLGEVLRHWADQERDTWSGSTFVRPAIALVVTEDVHPTSLGFQVGRRWWQLREGLSGSVTVVGAGDFALAQGAGSYDLSAAVLGGPWFEVVGLQVGPGFGYSRWTLGPAELVPAAGLDARAQLVADLKLVHVYGGLAPRWLVSGDRPAADVNPLGIGDELALEAGAGVTLGTLRLGFGWVRRFSGIGPIDRYGLDVRFRLL